MIYAMRTFPIEHPLPEAQACLLGVPWDSTETGVSVKHGPLFIREALRNLPGYDPETGKNMFDEVRFCDVGDVEVVPGSWALTKERMLDTLAFMSKESPDALPITLGGDHLITLGVLEALKARQPFTVAHFDAHADLSQDWMGEPFGHITWASHAVKMGLSLVQLGVRSWTREEQEFKERNRGMFKRLDEVSGPVYLTVDLDVLDPGFAPEVGTPEPGGLAPKEFFALLKKACSRPLVGLDIVECASRQVGTPTAALAAQIVKDVMLWRK